MSDYNGYELFNDVEDTHLQARNRAVVVYNIIEDSRVGPDVKAAGALEAIRYLRHVPDDERSTVISLLRIMLGEVKHEC